jgi:hypothetical protein
VTRLTPLREKNSGILGLPTFSLWLWADDEQPLPNQVLLKGMSSEKHFSLAAGQKYFPASSPPTTLPTPLF